MFLDLRRAQYAGVNRDFVNDTLEEVARPDAGPISCAVPAYSPVACKVLPACHISPLNDPYAVDVEGHPALFASPAHDLMPVAVVIASCGTQRPAHAVVYAKEDFARIVHVDVPVRFNGCSR